MTIGRIARLNASRKRPWNHTHSVHRLLAQAGVLVGRADNTCSRSGEQIPQQADLLLNVIHTALLRVMLTNIFLSDLDLMGSGV
jgi:hypothetical protein